MKRLLALLLAVGILTAIDPVRYVVAQDDKDKKEEKKDKDKDKDEKKDKDKEDKDKDKGKAAPDKPLTEDQKKELEALSGTFMVIEFEEDGKKKGADALKKMKVIQKGAEWTFIDGDDSSTMGKDTPFPDKTPKEIDSLYTNGLSRGKTVKGIYKIEGDTVIYCWAAPDKDRPKAFESKADSGLTILKLKKAPPEEKDKDKAKDKDKKDEKDKDKKDEKDKDKDKKEEKKDK